LVVEELPFPLEDPFFPVVKVEELPIPEDDPLEVPLDELELLSSLKESSSSLVRLSIESSLFTPVVVFFTPVVEPLLLFFLVRVCFLVVVRFLVVVGLVFVIFCSFVTSRTITSLPLAVLVVVNFMSRLSSLPFSLTALRVGVVSVGSTRT